MTPDSVDRRDYKSHLLVSITQINVQVVNKPLVPNKVRAKPHQ